MFLEKLRLQRYCQHLDRTFDFCPGLNVIVGPIGSGKSNILKAIRFLFTNASGNDGNRDADIQHGSDRSARSGVEGVGIHKGKRFFLNRFIRPSSRKFSWEGETVTFSAERAIADELQSRTNLDVDLFDEFIVVPQGEIANVIDLEPGKRLEAMQKLVGMDKYTKRYDWLGEYLTRTTAPIVRDDPEALHNELDALVIELFKARTDLSAARSFFLPEETLAAHKSLLASRSLAADLRSRLTKENSNAAVLTSSLDAVATIVLDLRKSSDHYKEALPGLQKTMEATAANLKLSNDKAVWQSLKAQVDRLKRDAISLPPPSDYIAVDSPRLAQLEQEGQDIAVLQRIKQLVDSGKNACPICFREVDQELKAPLGDLAQREAAHRLAMRSVQFSRQYDTLITQQQLNAKRAAELLPQMEREIDAYPPEIENAIDRFIVEGAHRKAQADYQECLAKQQQAERNLLIAQSQQATDTESLRLTKARIESIQADLANHPDIPESTYQEVQKILQDQGVYQTRAAHLEGSIAVMEKQQPLLRDRLDKAIEGQKQHDAVMEFREGISAGRDLFHRNNLPAEMSKNGMIALATKMNDLLAAFHSQYRVESLDGAKFAAHFFNQVNKGVQPDSRLSGGERAQFGLALRVATQTLWAQEVGFLALDEPTYGFGQSDMKCVAIAIEELRKLSSDQGLQVIVVTHEKSLLPLFDKVITIGG